MPINTEEKEIIEKSKNVENVSKYITKTQITKKIYIKNKLLNFITKK